MSADVRRISDAAPVGSLNRYAQSRRRSNLDEAGVAEALRTIAGEIIQAQEQRPTEIVTVIPVPEPFEALEHGKPVIVVAWGYERSGSVWAYVMTADENVPRLSSDEALGSQW